LGRWMGFQKVNIVMWEARGHLVGGKLADWTEGWNRADMLGVVADQQVCVKSCGGFVVLGGVGLVVQFKESQACCLVLWGLMSRGIYY
jgi:hypothetical protein